MMPLDNANLEYSRRRYGQDHDRYDWSLLHRRPPVKWPGDKRIALWITVAVEHFPLSDDGKPFKLPGAMAKPYPDYQTYTARDYGNRVGIYRVMRALDKAGLRANWAINGAVAEMLPGLLRDLDARQEEAIAHGWDMATPHHGGMDESTERALIDRSLKVLRGAISTPVRGWLSPGKSQSALTPDLLSEAGLDYLCDWPNDDMPYPMHTRSRALIALPHASELDDRQIIVALKHDESAFADQVLGQYRYLSREAEEHDGGRIVTLNLHPWVIGQSHRIGVLEKLLVDLAARDDIWSASGSEIVDCFEHAQATPGGGPPASGLRPEATEASTRA